MVQNTIRILIILVNGFLKRTKETFLLLRTLCLIQGWSALNIFNKENSKDHSQLVKDVFFVRQIYFQQNLRRDN